MSISTPCSVHDLTGLAPRELLCTQGSISNHTMPSSNSRTLDRKS